MGGPFCGWLSISGAGVICSGTRPQRTALPKLYLSSLVHRAICCRTRRPTSLLSLTYQSKKHFEPTLVAVLCLFGPRMGAVVNRCYLVIGDLRIALGGREPGMAH